jgi:predicted protein tyrosine phosphatase
VKKKILFICSRNEWRSRTAHEVFARNASIEVDSAGTESDARVVVESDHIEWADIIYVMEDRHLRRLKRMFSGGLKDKKVINLNIPDKYPFMDPELIEVFREKLGAYFP